MAIQSKVYTVTQVNKYVNGLLEMDPIISKIIICGEVSNFKGINSSGHAYFSLKDKESVIPGVIYKNNIRTGLKFDLKDGQKVVVVARVGMYTDSGKYQFYATKVELEGAGEINAEYERLKARLEAEGYFDTARKKPINMHPRAVGVIAGGTSSAIADYRRIAHDLSPYVQIYHFPALVQGKNAPEMIAKGIAMFDKKEDVDTIILIRGGGTTEERGAFDTEIVVKAIFNAKTPIISGVGHEDNFSIADNTADLRVSTPTEAAHKSIHNVMAEIRQLNDLYTQSVRAINQKVLLTNTRLNNYVAGLKAMDNRVSSAKSILDQRKLGLDAIYKRIDGSKLTLEQLRAKLEKASPGTKLVENKKELSELTTKLNYSMKAMFDDRNNRFAILLATMNGLSPTAKLINGFGYISKNSSDDTDNNDSKNTSVPVLSVADVKEGDEVSITIHDGVIKTKVVSIDEGKI